MNYQPNEILILIVEDDRLMASFLEAMLAKQGYKILIADNGQKAKDLISQYSDELHVIVLDWVLPDISGVQIVEWLKADTTLAQIPVIMQTGNSEPEQIKEGIDSGVFYYLVKPVQEEILKAVLSSAIIDSMRHKSLARELTSHSYSFKLVDQASFTIKTIDEAEKSSCFIANFFPEPHKILPAIAALLINAVEHGNCGITYEQKKQFLTDGTYRIELENRISEALKANKKVTVEYNKTDNNYILQITDDGDGFLAEKFIKADPARSLDEFGRGVARANMLFDSLVYNAKGNQVIATLNKQGRGDFKW